MQNANLIYLLDFTEQNTTSEISNIEQIIQDTILWFLYLQLMSYLTQAKIKQAVQDP